MSADELRPMLEAMAAARAQVLLAKCWNDGRAGKETPVGLVVTLAAEDGYLLTPRAVWFPWASSRNRLECAVKWLNEARKVSMPMFHVLDPLRGFFAHLCRYGVLREIGKAKHYPKPDGDSWAYQGVRMGDG